MWVLVEKKNIYININIIKKLERVIISKLPELRMW